MNNTDACPLGTDACTCVYVVYMYVPVKIWGGGGGGDAHTFTCLYNLAGVHIYIVLGYHAPAYMNIKSSSIF